MEMAKPAAAAPKVSSGRVYMLTLKAATAKMLSEIPAAAHPGDAAPGRGGGAPGNPPGPPPQPGGAAGPATPRPTNRKESQPPRNPPQQANTGGIQTYQAASWRVRW